MKLKLASVVFACIVLLLLLGGCNTTDNKVYYSDHFYYKILDNKNIVIGDISNDFSENFVFVPQEIDGYKVSKLGFTSGLGFGGNGYLTTVFDSKNVLERFYIPNTVEDIGERYMYLVSNNLKVFYCGELVNLGKLNIDKKIKIFVPNDLYMNFYEIIDKNYQDMLFRANVTYHLNYEIDNPYFYVDYYDYESKITYVPPEPTRIGYKFDGWYKDSKCTEIWDFESDQLPKLNENQDFNETKIYAKWKL